MGTGQVGREGGGRCQIQVWMQQIEPSEEKQPKSTNKQPYNVIHYITMLKPFVCVTSNHHPISECPYLKQTRELRCMLRGTILLCMFYSTLNKLWMMCVHICVHLCSYKVTHDVRNHKHEIRPICSLTYFYNVCVLPCTCVLHGVFFTVCVCICVWVCMNRTTAYRLWLDPVCVHFNMHACVRVCVRTCVCVFTVWRFASPPAAWQLSVPGQSICAKFHTPPHSPHMAPSGSPTSSSGYLKSIFLNCTWHIVCLSESLWKQLKLCRFKDKHIPRSGWGCTSIHCTLSLIFCK